MTLEQFNRPQLAVQSFQRRPRIELTVENGTVIVGSDCHYWPGIVTEAHRAFVELTKQLRPVAVVLNGDICDFATISRHEPDGWHPQPSLKDELEAVQDRLSDIEKVAKGAQLIRTIGNHDMRFDKRLAMQAPQYRGLGGTQLSDHIPQWKECISIWVNGKNTLIKHRWHNGVHATYNNTLKAGTNIVTGHLHRLKVEPWGDVHGRRFGVDTGTMADVDGPQFDYTEDNPVPWGSGFAVLTFVNGQLITPELCAVEHDGAAYFRGQPVRSKK